jgi:transposase-like protein
MKQPRNHYDKAFKIMAVDLYRSGKSFHEVSKDLDIEVGMSQRWNREYESFFLCSIENGFSNSPLNS